MLKKSSQENKDLQKALATNFISTVGILLGRKKRKKELSKHCQYSKRRQVLLLA